jgi:hypothetical protein
LWPGEKIRVEQKAVNLNCNEATMDPPTQISDEQLEDIVLRGKVCICDLLPSHIHISYLQAAVVARKLAAKDL